MDEGKISNLEHPVDYIKEGEKLVAGFDFQLQRSLIQRITEKCGISNPHLVEPPRIINYDKPGILGHHYPDTYKEFLGINFTRLFETESDPTKRKLLFWHLLNHEQLHAASSELEYGDSGYKSSLGSYHMFNEGVTEMIARIITKEYYNASGYSAAPAPDFIYSVPVAFAELIIKKISDAVGIDLNTVQEAIIRGFFERQSFLEEGFMELFAGVLPESFDRDLQWANQRDMKRVISSSNLEDLKLSPEQENELKTNIENIDAASVKKLWDDSVSKVYSK